MTAADSILWDPLEPLKPAVNRRAGLMRIINETPKANQALRDYVFLGAGRSFASLIKSYQAETKAHPKFKPPTVRLATLKNWSTRWRWQLRLADYNRLQGEIDERLYQERRLALAEFDWRDSVELRERSRDILEELPKFIDRVEEVIENEDGTTTIIVYRRPGAKITELAQTLRISSQLGRSAVGEADVTIGEPLDLDQVRRARWAQVTEDLESLHDDETENDQTPPAKDKRRKTKKK